ncbi:MAG: dihydrodipicolinate synthase family protein [Candidatus Aminicenantes bacterium]|nr:MAG: dihydrodipicolinate synthase family protein [Candidatus Aminicenantes bacterium]
MVENLHGVFAALTTPFENGKIAIKHFWENIQKYNTCDLAGYVIAGSSGEAAYLTEEESVTLVKEALETSAPDKKIIVGSARESTASTIAFTKRMADLGIKAALIRTPSYFKSVMTSEALKNHYYAIADEARIPVIPYHIPQVTGISIEQKLVIDLSKHPNIVGIKDSSGNLPFLGEVLPNLPSDFSYLLGAGSVFLFGLSLGASGGILRLADVIPDLCATLYNDFLAGDWEKASKLQRDVIPLNNAIIQKYGIAGAKYAMDLLGYYGGPPRDPILPLEASGKREIEKILKSLNLIK